MDLGECRNFFILCNVPQHVAADKGGMVNEYDADDGDGMDDGEASDASDASGGAIEDALGDLSD